MSLGETANRGRVRPCARLLPDPEELNRRSAPESQKGTAGAVHTPWRHAARNPRTVSDAPVPVEQARDQSAPGRPCARCFWRPAGARIAHLPRTGALAPSQSCGGTGSPPKAGRVPRESPLRPERHGMLTDQPIDPPAPRIDRPRHVPMRKHPEIPLALQSFRARSGESQDRPSWHRSLPTSSGPQLPAG